jgi:hypothetical protein
MRDETIAKDAENAGTGKGGGINFGHQTVQQTATPGNISHSLKLQVERSPRIEKPPKMSRCTHGNQVRT